MHGEHIARVLALGLFCSSMAACAGGAGNDGDGSGALTVGGTDPGTAGTQATQAGDDEADETATGPGSDGSDGPSGLTEGATTGCVEQSFFLDADEDGHGDPLAEVVACVAPLGHVPLGDDCDDADPTNAPSLREICDSKDNDCDRMIDEPPASADCQGCTAATNAGTTYYFCPDPLAFDAARSQCMVLGGDLLKVDDQAELDFLAGAGIPASAGAGGWRNGLSDQATEGAFVWTDGTAPAVTPWNGGEPNDAGGNEDCVEMTVTADAWNDIPCAEPRAFVCESG